MDTIRIDDVLVDIEALASLAHRCDPRLCGPQHCCCAEYEVRLTPGEVSRVVGVLPTAVRFAPALEGADGIENVFDGCGDDVCALDTEEDGLCALAYRNADGSVLCSLHSAAAELGVDPFAVKPDACSLWPLAITELHPTVLSVQPGAWSFPCNTRRGGRPDRLDPGVEAIVVGAFGEGFRTRLAEALARWAGGART